MIWAPALSGGGWKQGCSPGWAGPAALEDGATLPGPWSPQEAGGLTPGWGAGLEEEPFVQGLGCCPSF